MAFPLAAHASRWRPNISLMRTGPAGHFDELVASLGFAIMIGRASRRIARGR